MAASPLHAAGLRARDRAGYTLADALVATALITVIGLFALMALTRGRESARMTTCQRNLAQIGVGLALYHDSQKALPMIGEPTPIEPPPTSAATNPGPLRTILETLGVSSPLGLHPEGLNLASLKGPLPAGYAVPGFFCPSDPHAIGGIFASPVSYRATTGDDPEGRTGGFALGRRTTLREIEDADGVSYTAAFSERLVGDGQAAPAPENYTLVDGPVAVSGCFPDPEAAAGADWRGDAGSTWEQADWRSTLYNHALTPGSKISCLARDGRSALVGASSGHTAGIHLLMFDGGVRRIARSVDRKIWLDYGSVGAPIDPRQPPPPPIADQPKRKSF